MTTRRSPVAILLALLVAVLAGVAPQQTSARTTPTYTNPLAPVVPGNGVVESCADPSIIRGQQPGDTYWYMYCTTDPLNGADRNASGDLNFRIIPTLRSIDLVNWEYVGDAFTPATRPAWVAPSGGIWAPDIQYFNGQYYLYYTASETVAGGSAIGVATSSTPTGPWVDTGAPVVEPHPAPCCPDSRRWTYDASIVADDAGNRYIYYGSYFGGISVRRLSADGLTSDPASQREVAIANRYEGAYVVRRFGYYYMFVSATDCCRGPLTGYTVFAGRSTSPFGPFVDREGVGFLEGRVGGTPVISMNGNRWVGPGHNAVFADLSGQYWTVYHAVDRFDPYFEGAVGFTKRPALLDRMDWVDGWPTVRGGLWASDTPQRGPAAQPGDRYNAPLKLARPDLPGNLVARSTEEFGDATLVRDAAWVREPVGGYTIADGVLRMDTQAADLFENSNNASVLTIPAPRGPYIVETRVRVDVPAEGCCFNYVQAGLVIYGDDDNFIKLTIASIWETRQTEFAKELGPVPAGFPRYGNTVVGPPAEWTYLRIVVRPAQNDEQYYTAYTSRDGQTWVRGGTWTHTLGTSARIGLVAMGGSGFHADFDYVRTYQTSRGSSPAEAPAE